MKQQKPVTNIELRLLRLFDVLYATRNVSRAADELYVSQPTASSWLRQLRTALGDELFVRTAGGVTPTARAEELLPQVRAVLDALDQLEASRSFDPATTHRRFSIHVTDGAHLALLPPIVHRMATAAPSARLQVAGLGPRTGRALRGEADLAVGFAPQLDAEQLERQRLYGQDWVCLMRADHPAAARLDLDTYVRLTHANVTRHTWTELLGSTLSALDVRRDVVLELPSVFGLVTILPTSDSVATLPRHISQILAEVSGLRIVRCPIPVPPFYLNMYWHSRRTADPEHAWFRTIVAETFVGHDVFGFDDV